MTVLFKTFFIMNLISMSPAVKMLIPKKNRVAIYEYLFKEGVLVAKEDKFAPKHANIDIPNLEVTKAMEVDNFLF